MVQYIKINGIIALLVIGLLSVGGCTGGGETVISGIGNSGNLMSRDDEIEMLAGALAAQTVIPRISDEQILKLYTNVQEKALAGDTRASIVVLKLASFQRKKEQQEES